ncbi:hypothetical protein HDE_09535 [Halotydeus destructor]|nr:hypothetical protein HDE_09535 [Halotydeus destructor]
MRQRCRRDFVSHENGCHAFRVFFNMNFQIVLTIAVLVIAAMFDLTEAGKKTIIIKRQNKCCKPKPKCCHHEEHHHGGYDFGGFGGW